jgi:hypothetical protein
VNYILARAGLDVKSSYLPGKRERYAYISVTALLAVLESQDPIIVCLEEKEKFSQVSFMFYFNITKNL